MNSQPHFMHATDGYTHTTAKSTSSKLPQNARHTISLHHSSIHITNQSMASHHHHCNYHQRTTQARTLLPKTNPTMTITTTAKKKTIKCVMC